MPLVAAVSAPHAPQLLATPDTSNAEMIKAVHEAMGKCKEHLASLDVDTVVCIANDHVEGFFLDAVPAFAVYTGLECRGSFGPGRQYVYKVNTHLAEAILWKSLEDDFDLAYSQNLSMDYAFFIPLHFMHPSTEIPIVPLFVNAYLPPQPTPRRCYAWGRELARILAERPERIALVASGGLSHYPGTVRYSNPDFSFDRWVLDVLEKGQGSELAKLTSEDLDKAGNIELRPWITALGVVGDAPAEVLTYQPEWHHGYGVIKWDVKQATDTKAYA